MVELVAEAARKRAPDPADVNVMLHGAEEFDVAVEEAIGSLIDKLDEAVRLADATATPEEE